MHGDDAEGASLAEVHRAELGLAKPRCVLQHRLKYGLKFARRAADDLQHLRSCRLLLKGFA
jgi:hypothetical protein